MTGKVTWDRAGNPHYFADGVEVTEAEFAGHFPPAPEGPLFGGAPSAPARWPLRSAALAVHTDQVVEANERNKKHGVNVTYDPQSGRAIIPDAAAYKRLRKLEGVHDKDSYTGY